MNDFIFFNNCADRLEKCVLENHWAKKSSKEISAEQAAVVEECFNEYQKNGFCEISFDYFSRVLYDLLRERTTILYAYSM